MFDDMDGRPGSPSRRPGPFRLLVCDQQALVLAGLRTVLTEVADIELAEDANSIDQLIERIRLAQPDLVLIGVPLTGCELVPTVRRILACGQRLSVVLMSGEEDEPNLLEALRAGVRGVVSRRCPPAHLLRDLRIVAAGGVVLTPSMAGQLLDFAMSASPAPDELPPAATALTPRERDVLALVAQGFSDATIANTFWISKVTVRSHVHRVLMKLGVSNRAQAVAYFYEHGLVRTLGQIPAPRPDYATVNGRR